MTAYPELFVRARPRRRAADGAVYGYDIIDPKLVLNPDGQFEACPSHFPLPQFELGSSPWMEQTLETTTQRISFDVRGAMPTVWEARPRGQRHWKSWMSRHDRGRQTAVDMVVHEKWKDQARYVRWNSTYGGVGKMNMPAEQFAPSIPTKMEAEVVGTRIDFKGEVIPFVFWPIGFPDSNFTDNFVLSWRERQGQRVITDAFGEGCHSLSAYDTLPISLTDPEDRAFMNAGFFTVNQFHCGDGLSSLRVVNLDREVTEDLTNFYAKNPRAKAVLTTKFSRFRAGQDMKVVSEGGPRFSDGHWALAVYETSNFDGSGEPFAVGLLSQVFDDDRGLTRPTRLSLDNYNIGTSGLDGQANQAALFMSCTEDGGAMLAGGEVSVDMIIITKATFAEVLDSALEIKKAF